MTAMVLAAVLSLSAAQAAADLPNLLLPPGDSAWVVRIVTSGGFTGRGSGNVTASSAGRVICTLVASCPDRLVPETTRAVSAWITTVGRTKPSGAQQIAPHGICADCVTTAMTIQRRDDDGEHTFRYTWDVSTVRTIPEDVLRLHAAITGLIVPP